MRVQFMVLLTAMVLLGCKSAPKDNTASNKNFEQVVRRIYMQAWQPEDVVTINANLESVTKVRVVVARDGSVISARIVKPSGDGQMDNSVQAVLDKIKFVQPFELGAKAERRTFLINFVETEEMAPAPS